MPKLDTRVRWRVLNEREVARLIPLPDSPPCLIPLRLTPRKMRAQLVPREMMGEAVSKLPLDGKCKKKTLCTT